MRLKKFLNEKKSSVTVAFWISPDDEVIGSLETHIQQIIQNASKFGLKLQDIRDIYNEYDERVGMEGKAREEIIERILTEGWMRIRKYPNIGYSVTVGHARMLNWEYLIEWAQMMLDRGIMGFGEKDESAPVYITDLLNHNYQMTMKEVADYAEIKGGKLEIKEMLEEFIDRSVSSDFWTKDYINKMKEEYGE